MFISTPDRLGLAHGIALFLSLPVTLFLLGLNSPAFAGANANGKVAIHVLQHASRSCTKNFPSISGCEDIITTEVSPDADCFPVFYDLVEYSGFEYGLTWPGLYSCIFTSCSDLTIGNIVYPGDGVSHAWSTCQTTAVAIPGWGWIYDYGLIEVVDHPVSGAIKIADCSSGFDTPLQDFCAGIGGVGGADPCSVGWGLDPDGPTTPISHLVDSCWTLGEETVSVRGMGFVSHCSGKDLKTSSIDLSFHIAHAAYVTLTVFDVHGRRVRKLLEVDVPPGIRTLVWDGTDDSGRLVSAGVYFAQLRTSTASVTKKAMIAQ